MLLLPGASYLVELSLSRLTSPEVLIAGLRKMGWVNVVLDDGHESRFVGQPDRVIEAADTVRVRWIRVEAIPSEVTLFATPRLQLFPFGLERGRVYGLHLMMRNADLRGSGKSGRVSVRERLSAMGFEIMSAPIEVVHNGRLPDKPNASISFWYAVGRWEKVRSVVSGEDPFFFETIAEILQQDEVLETSSTIMVSTALSA